MMKFDLTTDIHRPLTQVFAFVTTPDNDFHWQYGTLMSAKISMDASPWIDSAATMLSDRHQSVTILINGGDISRKDIELRLKKGRPVIALSGTGPLADELARQPERDQLISIVPVHTEQRILKTIQAALSMPEKGSVTPLTMHEKVVSEM